MLVVDTSVLLAAADKGDPDHARCSEALEAESTLVTTGLVVAEVAYLVERQLGSFAVAGFFQAIAAGEIRVEPLHEEDAARIAELVATYSDLGLGGTDASLVALAERLDAARVATLDHRHFQVVRPRHRSAFEIVP